MSVHNLIVFTKQISITHLASNSLIKTLRWISAGVPRWNKPKMIWSLVLFQELLLCFTVFASEEDSLSRSAYFITRENKHLAGHVVQRLKSSNLMSCNHICITTSWCTSTNFKESTQCNEDDKGICELNIHEFVHFNENTKLIDQPGVTFSVFLKVSKILITYSELWRQNWLGNNFEM